MQSLRRRSAKRCRDLSFVCSGADAGAAGRAEAPQAQSPACLVAPVFINTLCAHLPEHSTIHSNSPVGATALTKVLNEAQGWLSRSHSRFFTRSARSLARLRARSTGTTLSWWPATRGELTARHHPCHRSDLGLGHHGCRARCDDVPVGMAVRIAKLEERFHVVVPLRSNDFLYIFLRPDTQPVQRRRQRHAQRSDAVLDRYRYSRKDSSRDQAVALQTLQSLREHLL